MQLLAAENREQSRVPVSGKRRALDQLLRPSISGASGGLESWREHVQYTCARLAKLGVPLSEVHAELAKFRPLAVARLRPRFGPRRAGAMVAWLQQQIQLELSQAYLASQSNAVAALLAVLDAELGAADLNHLLQQLLRHAAQVFPLRWAEVLLVEDGRRLRHAATLGLEPGMILEPVGVGSFFQDVLRRGKPAFLLDAANDPRVAQPYFRTLEVKSVWAVPLLRRVPNRGREVLGVLCLAFDRTYECLPKERDLLLALAERSSMAIERTRMAERLGREQARVTELSRRLLDAQDEERRRISRDLHDETGQSLMALRLYLEMGLRQPSPANARHWLAKGISLVDQSVAELRRLLAELSPLLLDELGLEAALRLELRRLRAQQQWRTRFQFCCPTGRLDPKLEILAYRVVLEGLRNAARHAHARRVDLRIAADHAGLDIRLRDDGVGLPASAPAASARFGLAGMRERVRLAGGTLELSSADGTGLCIAVHIPLIQHAAAAAHAS